MFNQNIEIWIDCSIPLDKQGIIAKNFWFFKFFKYSLFAFTIFYALVLLYALIFQCVSLFFDLWSVFGSENLVNLLQISILILTLSFFWTLIKLIIFLKKINNNILKSKFVLWLYCLWIKWRVSRSKYNSFISIDLENVVCINLKNFNFEIFEILEYIYLNNLLHTLFRFDWSFNTRIIKKKVFFLNKNIDFIRDNLQNLEKIQIIIHDNFSWEATKEWHRESFIVNKSWWCYFTFFETNEDCLFRINEKQENMNFYVNRFEYSWICLYHNFGYKK